MTRAFAAFLLSPMLIAGAQSSAGSIIPRPDSVRSGRGEFTLTARTVLVTDRADSAVAQRFARSLADATGFTLPVRVGATSTGNRIVFRRAAPRDTSLGAEGYRLEVKPGVVTITSAAPAGAFYATQSLRQLFPANIFRSAPLDGASWKVPAVTIVDRTAGWSVGQDQLLGPAES